MIQLRNILVVLLLSTAITAQTKLVIFSEDNQTFVADINNNITNQDPKVLFEFSNFKEQKVVLKVELENNHKLKKTIRLNSNMQNIYTISNKDGYYEILYRGSYKQEEEVEKDNNFSNKIVTNTEKKDIKPSIVIEEVDNANNVLININSIIDELPSKQDDKAKTLFIVDELNKGKFNCRQLKFIFSKIDNDYSKLFTFKSTIHKCVDKENLINLMSSFESEKYQENFKQLISYL